MDERFNKTLARMLSTYVQDHQRDWDRYLPYVMMANRSAEHETTGFTPNFLMLGRDVSTPLDIMYEMPPSVKAVPQSRWVWELKEQMEQAHTLVRESVQGEMQRQKRYHDLKLSWQKFKPGEEVYVYFPIRKSGCSSKLTSFWRGPYEIVRKFSDVTYEVKCGPRGKPQVIHVDRMKKRYQQNLREEPQRQESDKGNVMPPTIIRNDENQGSIGHSENEEINNQDKYLEVEVQESGKRRRREPAWLKDFVKF